MLGLASETGSIRNAYKKYLRDGIDLIANREALREELGDLLATSCQLNLEDIAIANLRRTRDRYNQVPTLELLAALPDFDLRYPEPERFPRSLAIEFIEQVDPTGQLTAMMTLISAAPNSFVDGPPPRLDLASCSESGGFNAMRELAANGDGYLVADFDRPTLTYRKILSEALTEDAT
jgi:hypothetical protein